MIRKKSIHLLFIFIPIVTLLATGCSLPVEDLSSDDLDKPAQVTDTQTKENTQENDEAQKEPTDEEIVNTNIRFDFSTLPKHFVIGNGDSAYNSYDHRNRLSEMFYGSIDMEGFWLVSQFYEPKKFLFEDFNEKEPIDVGNLVNELTRSEVPVEQTEWGYKIGPFPYYGEHYSNHCFWTEYNDIALGNSRHISGLASLTSNKSYFLGHGLKRQAAFSPEHDGMAFLRDGKLVIMNINGEERGNWDVYEGEFGTDFISWSPNGRFILGSWTAGSKPLIDKLWALDTTTGEFMGFGGKPGNYFAPPSWSPDGTRAMVYKAEHGYSGDSTGSWVCLDLPSRTKQDFMGDPNGTVKWMEGINEDPDIIPMNSLEVSYIIRDAQTGMTTDDFWSPYETVYPDDFQGTQIDIIADDESIQGSFNLCTIFEKNNIVIPETVQQIITQASPTFDCKYLYVITRWKETSENGQQIEHKVYGTIDLQNMAPQKFFMIDSGITECHTYQSFNKVILKKENEVGIHDFETQATVHYTLPEALQTAYLSKSKAVAFTETGVSIFYFDPKEPVYHTLPEKVERAFVNNHRVFCVTENALLEITDTSAQELTTLIGTPYPNWARYSPDGSMLVFPSIEDDVDALKWVTLYAFKCHEIKE